MPTEYEAACLNCSLPFGCDDTSPKCNLTQITRTPAVRTEPKLDYKKYRNMDRYREYQREYQRERYRANEAVRERKKLTSKQWRTVKRLTLNDESGRGD